MDLVYPLKAEEFRARVRRVVQSSLPDGWSGIGSLPHEEAAAFAASWRTVLADNHLLAPSWPSEYGGGGLSAVEQVVLAEELAKAGVPAGIPNDVFSIAMVGNTILHWGTEDQKQYFLPRILSGQDVWCQGYSEPNAGSDLANLGCRAVLDGDEWVINGQKIWTSGGHLANWIFVLARTDSEAPRHRGISFLLVPMDQPGLEVRPIRMMTGASEFNETFFTDVRCPKDNVVGEINGGWAVAMTLLGFERGEAAATLPIMFADEYRRLLDLARRTGATSDAVLRDRLADAYVRLEIMRYLGMISVTKYLRGDEPGADAALSKLWWSEYHQRVTELSLSVLGADSMVYQGRPSSSFSIFQTDDPGSPGDPASWIGTAMVARSGTIYAGTSEIQRNIIGEKLLGLPKEPT
jgi:alkylation response protein AidB-like acyl-CoA dehydrogenase